MQRFKNAHRPLRTETRSLPCHSVTAFSLIEMLVVVAIMITLMGMLMAGVGMAKSAARKGRARAEVGSIADGWKLYFAEYQRWPDAIRDGAAHPMSVPISELLSSGEYGPQNPRRIRFCQYSRTNTVGDVISPWGDADSHTATEEWLYHVAVDHDFNNLITGPAGLVVTGRAVAVWTTNPDIDDDDSINNPEEIIGSWIE